MEESIEEDDAPESEVSRWKQIALVVGKFAPTVVSITCAALTGYFAYLTMQAEPPGDISKLAIAILQSDDTSPEMRDWATRAIGITPGISLGISSNRP